MIIYKLASEDVWDDEIEPFRATFRYCVIQIPFIWAVIDSRLEALIFFTWFGVSSTPFEDIIL